jgi:hypothetical protein
MPGCLIHRNDRLMSLGGTYFSAIDVTPVEPQAMVQTLLDAIPQQGLTSGAQSRRCATRSLRRIPSRSWEPSRCIWDLLKPVPTPSTIDGSGSISTALRMPKLRASATGHLGVLGRRGSTSPQSPNAFEAQRRVDRPTSPQGRSGLDTKPQMPHANFSADRPLHKTSLC